MQDEDFKWEVEKDYNKEENLKALLEQHKDIIYKKAQAEYEPQIESYKNQVNEYQEQKLFENLTPKQIKLTKALITTEYKEFNKEEAVNQIKEDYKEIFKATTQHINNENIFNPKDLLTLHHQDEQNQIFNIQKKAKTKGLSNQNELNELIKATFAELK